MGEAPPRRPGGSGAEGGEVPVGQVRTGRQRGVAVTRTEGPSAKHLALLATGDLDLAVVADTSAEPPSGCTPHHLLDERMYVALPSGHRLAGRAEVRPAELADEEWIAADTGPRRP
ncbi:LysR family transcriptional regulator substrate-binding protein [Streptomyces virginiae]|uniref:LysR family transcriptional regulator substrate-binding protein n=1 Tax=Streptomyces virginiae TaxID=1961 RepID=UPI0022526256|nr:LysR family transcriptional regulator substrate-binding protein [Streptomyces virginiae]MCX5179488.1 LysR family transcriptional regulator substrate-binding protein [Streptomyces virginiae]